MSAILLRRMKRDFARRQSKDQPATPSIHRSKPQHIAEKRAIRVSILAVHNHMRA